MRPRLVILLAVGSAVSVHAQVPIVAVLEYPQCAGDSVLAARPLFAKTGDRWTPLASAQAAKVVDLRVVEWTVALDGRRLGTVRTTDPGFSTKYDWTYPRDRRLTVASVPAPPVVANANHAFRGWCSAPPSRPLVLVTPANYRDPDQWKPLTRSGGMDAALFAAFKNVAGQAERCLNGSTKPTPFAYRPANVVEKSRYRDRAGRLLVALQLDERLYGCDGMRDDESWDVHWFLVDHDIRSLGANLELVDAGDYDADGVSELLFWHSGHHDGYTLFYDSFRRQADFSWMYH